MSTLGMNLRVTTDSKQGGRKYMEDCLSVKFHKSTDGKNIEYAFLGIFDGHGGVHAAQFAKEHLLDDITKHKGFWTTDDSQVMKAIKDGFLSTHHKMWKIVGTWPRTLSGHPSTAGTTVSVVFLKNGKIYVGHVGDSSVVLGRKKESMLSNLTGEMITVDHKPESPKELKRIQENGGTVVAKAGVQRVVWNRPRASNQGVVRRSTPIDRIPFLAIARALGDLWSYNTGRDVFVVSPEPDVITFALDLNETHCIVVASDGLWNMVRAQEAVDLVDHVDEESRDPFSTVKPASCLVRLALDRWADRGLRADNTSVIVCLLDPPEDEGANADTAPALRAQTSATPSQASTRKLSEGNDECHSDSECGEDEDVVGMEVDQEDTQSSDEEDIEEGDDNDMSHLHMGSPATPGASTNISYPKIMYPSPHILKTCKATFHTEVDPELEKDRNEKQLSYPRALMANSSRFHSASGRLSPMKPLKALRTPKSAPSKVKRLQETRSSTPNSVPVPKGKKRHRSHTVNMARMRQKIAMARAIIEDQKAQDTSCTHNLRVRAVSQQKAAAIEQKMSKMPKVTTVAYPGTSAKLPHHTSSNNSPSSTSSTGANNTRLCNTELSRDIDSKTNRQHYHNNSNTSRLALNKAAAASATVSSSSVQGSGSSDTPDTPSKELRCDGSSSPKQALSAKSPIRVHTNPRGAATPSMISPMWPSSLASADFSEGDQPLEGGVADDPVLTENGSNKSGSAAVRNFTALFSQTGSQNRAPHSPNTRACVKRLGTASAGSNACTNAVQALSAKDTSVVGLLSDPVVLVGKVHVKSPRTVRKITQAKKS